MAVSPCEFLVDIWGRDVDSGKALAQDVYSSGFDSQHHQKHFLIKGIWENPKHKIHA